MRHAIRQPPTSRLSEDCNVDYVLVRHMSMICSSQLRRINNPGLCELGVFAFVFLILLASLLKEWCFEIHEPAAIFGFVVHLSGLSYTFLTLGNDRLPTFYNGHSTNIPKRFDVRSKIQAGHAPRKTNLKL